MEVNVGNEVYFVGKMGARQQRNVFRRILPLIAAMEATSADLKAELNAPDSDMFSKAIGPIAKAIGAMSDADSDYIFETCFGAVKRKTQGSWQGISSGGELRFQDITMPQQVQLVFYVIKENFADFLDVSPGPSKSM